MIRHDKKDLLWFFVIAAILLVLGSLPYWYGQAAQTDTLLFRGAYFDEGDYAVHISMMRAGRMGDWAYEMRFTSEPHQPAFLRMFYIILGHVSKWINLSVETTFELARWILGFATLFAIYRLSLRVFPQRSHARFAFALAAFGSGLGWLQLMAGVPLEPISPIDFWLIDAYVFFSLSLFPSFAFTLMLMAAALSLYLDYLQSPNWQRILWISSLFIACQIVNPIAFAVIDAAFAGVTQLAQYGPGFEEIISSLKRLEATYLLVSHGDLAWHVKYHDPSGLQEEAYTKLLQYFPARCYNEIYTTDTNSMYTLLCSE